jgi:hypothetical protein
MNLKQLTVIVRIVSTISKVLDVEATAKVRNASMCRIASLALRAKTSPFRTDGQLKQFLHNSKAQLVAYKHVLTLEGNVLEACELTLVKSLIAKGLVACDSSSLAMKAMEVVEVVAA